MSEILKFQLNNKYRNPVSVEATESMFSGRNEEIKKLKNIIISRTAATVIIGGVRGVGKTSFVRECLRQLKNKNDLIVSDISLADFNESVDSKGLRDKVLKALIRSLYFALKENERSEDLKSLYDKTYYSELKETKLLELVKAEESSSREVHTSEHIYKITTSDAVINIAKIVFVSLLCMSSFWALAIYIKGGWFIAGLAVLILLVFIVLKFDLQFKKKDEVENKVLDRASAKVGSSGIAAFDLSADTLEIKLRQILCASEKKIVFVIDELDKLNDTSDSLSDHAVFQIIKPLKNLFSLSNAIFLFIGADDFFDKLENETTINPYSASHTIFTDRIFLNSMYYEDINNLIDSYRTGDFLLGNEQVYKKFKSFIGWKAKNHIFDTHNIIDSYTVHDDSDGVFVSVKQDDEISKGNIQDDWEVAAGLQLFIAVTFENRRYPGINRLNEKLYLTLRQVAQIFYEQYEIDMIGNNFFDILKEDQQKKLKIDNLSYEDQNNFEGAIEDLLLRMERSGFCNITEEKDVDVDQKPIIRYTYEFANTEFPNEIEIREKNKQLGFEIEFLREFDELTKRKVILENNEWSSFSNYTKEYARLAKVVDPIRNEQKKREPKSKIISFTERIRSIYEELKDVAFAEMMGKVLKEVGATKVSISQNSAGQNMWVTDPKIADFYNHLHTEINEDQYSILEHNTKYVLVGLSFDEDLQNIYLTKASYLQRKNAKTKIINVILDESIVNKSQQMKWSEIKGKNDLSDLKNISKKIITQVKKYLN